ncbi:MAG TPA: DivIVA domain-containing protein [Chthonomonadaceae bacterium]|nr:DivIVA domain-containing protein [Chthonomonadaceae bacterium]
MSQRLTPVDILNLRFRRGVRGYAIAEVDDFVRRVAADLEAALAENAALRERIGALEREISGFRSLETTMRDALVLAQKAADEMRAAAHAQAEAQVQEAQARVRDIEARLQARVSETAAQLETLRRERRRLARDMRAQLAAHLDWLTAELAGEDLEDPAAEGPLCRETAISRTAGADSSAPPEEP